MRQPSILFSDTEIQFLRELTRHKVPFMVVGLAAAALQGAPMVTQDVDLWFKDLTHLGLRKALRKVDGTLVTPAGPMPPMLMGASVECFDIVLTVDGVGAFDEEMRQAIPMALGDFSLRVLPLARIIASKTFLNREKDRMVLPALKSAFRALEGR